MSGLLGRQVQPAKQKHASADKRTCSKPSLVYQWVAAAAACDAATPNQLVGVPPPAQKESPLQGSLALWLLPCLS